jgi:hypothetical protein
MTGGPLGARGSPRRAAVWIVAAIVGGGVQAQSTGEISEVAGFKAGAAIVAPSLTLGYAYDTNVLAIPDDFVPPPSPDAVLTVQPALALTLPFSNSMFRFGDVLTYVDYKNTPQTNGKTSNDAVADLTLNFGTLDRLDIAAHNITGVAQSIAFDPGGEATFQGNSFTLHTEAVSLSREIDGARGYRLSLERNAVRFDPSITVNFFNYRGFDGEAAFLQPVSPKTWISFGYLGTRYDHFFASDPSVVFRSESGDAIYGQIEGQLGPRQPYTVRLGWQRLNFSGPGVNEADSFSGIIGQAKLSAIVGGGTMFTVLAQRQPYRSFVTSNNYYVFDVLGLWVDRPFPQGSSVGGDIAFSSNGYNQPISEGLSDTPFYRQDRRFLLEAYANLALAKRIAFRVSLARNRRYSNAPGADYNDTVVFGGFVFGWI